MAPTPETKRGRRTVLRSIGLSTLALASASTGVSATDDEPNSRAEADPEEGWAWSQNGAGADPEEGWAWSQDGAEADPEEGWAWSQDGAEADPEEGWAWE